MNAGKGTKVFGFGKITEKALREVFAGADVGKVKSSGLLDHTWQVEVVFDTKEQAKKAGKLLKELSKNDE